MAKKSTRSTAESTRRKVEAYHLVISGIGEGQDYGKFLRDLRDRFDDAAAATWDSGAKSHCLYDVVKDGAKWRIRFFSFRRGYRPDVLDTVASKISNNPLSDSETTIDWTHVLAGQTGDHFLLVFERSQAGIYPTTAERYLQWMANQQEAWIAKKWQDDGERDSVVFSLKPVASAEFLRRVREFERITRATLRTVRPNPGWKDLDKELGREAGESDAHNVDVTMTARRGASLDKRSGIVEAILEKAQSKDLDFAAIEGEINGTKDRVNSKQLIDHSYADFLVDRYGKVQEHDAWARLKSLFSMFA